MSPKAFKPGFSLTEVLMAAGILLVGFLLIAGTFPVGVKLTAVSTERTIGVVASEEAMAKIHLYGIDDPRQMPVGFHIPYDGVSVAQYRAQTDFISSWALARLKVRYPGIATLDAATDTFPALTTYFQYESLYPSTAFFDYTVPTDPQIRTNPEDPQRYFWSALCRRLDSSTTEIQVTIFVCRMAGQNAQYPLYNFNRLTGAPLANPWATSPYPTPVPLTLQTVGTPILLTVNNLVAPVPDTASPYYYATLSFASTDTPQVRAIVCKYLSPGSVLLEDLTGRMMRVLEVVAPDPTKQDDLGRIRLMRMPDSDGNPKSIELADVQGLLRVEQSAWNPTTPIRRQMWLIPPAQAGAAAGGTTPPNVAGRNPCVGVFQGQL